MIRGSSGAVIDPLSFAEIFPHARNLRRRQSEVILRPMKGSLALPAVVGVLAAPLLALAQPTFEYGKREDAEGVVWKAQAAAGLILTTGNSQTLALSGSVDVSRKDGKNQIAFGAAGAF